MAESPIEANAIPLIFHAITHGWCGLDLLAAQILCLWVLVAAYPHGRLERGLLDVGGRVDRRFSAGRWSSLATPEGLKAKWSCTTSARRLAASSNSYLAAGSPRCDDGSSPNPGLGGKFLSSGVFAIREGFLGSAGFESPLASPGVPHSRNGPGFNP
jgi:hypothetical protein